MATLAGQRAQFTWSLNQYNLAEDAETRAKYAKRMAKYVAEAPTNGFTVDEVTQGQIYPASEVDQYISDASTDEDPGITEEQAIKRVEEAVDTTDVVRKGEGAGNRLCLRVSLLRRSSEGWIYGVEHSAADCCADRYQHAR
jgi:hypothetical protein